MPPLDLLKEKQLQLLLEQCQKPGWDAHSRERTAPGLLARLAMWILRTTFRLLILLLIGPFLLLLWPFRRSWASAGRAAMDEDEVEE